jgi:hypothetical protein
MQIPKDLPELTALFERLGAKSPDSWAESQIDEGIPQLHRFLFLRQAWSNVTDDGATKWIDYQRKQAERAPDAPFSGMGHALDRAVKAGVSADDLTEIVRCAQAELLFQLCYMLEDNGLPEPELEGLGWGLFQTDESGQPIGPIYGLHESVLSMDPTGREMCPPKKP